MFHGNLDAYEIEARGLRGQEQLGGGDTAMLHVIFELDSLEQLVLCGGISTFCLMKQTGCDPD